MEKMDEAKECFEESISLKTEFYGDQHLSLALSLHEFGSLHLKLDNFSVSLEVLKSALKIRKHELGLNHEETTATIIKIGEVYFRQEEYAASLSCFEQVLSILKTFDNNGNSAKILFVCNSFIGTIHHKEGRFDSAVVSLKEAVQCKECNTSIGIAFHDTLQYLGSALQITNRHGEAIEYLQLGKFIFIYYAKQKCSNTDQMINYSPSNLFLKLLKRDWMNLVLIQKTMQNLKQR